VFRPRVKWSEQSGARISLSVDCWLLIQSLANVYALARERGCRETGVRRFGEETLSSTVE